MGHMVKIMTAIYDRRTEIRDCFVIRRQTQTSEQRIAYLSADGPCADVAQICGFDFKSLDPRDAAMVLDAVNRLWCGQRMIGE